MAGPGIGTPTALHSEPKQTIIDEDFYKYLLRVSDDVSKWPEWIKENSNYLFDNQKPSFSDTENSGQ